MTTAAQDLLLAAAGRPDMPGHGTVWVDALRAHGRDHLSLPTIRDEDWRYTNLRSIERKFPAPVVELPDADVTVPDRIAGLATIRLVFVDGWFSARLSDGHIHDGGIVVENLANVLQRDPDLVKGVMGEKIGKQAHGFTAMNDAMLSDGCVISFAKNAVLHMPIELVYVSTGEGRSRFARNVIRMDQGSQATVIERFAGNGLDVSGFSGVITEADVGPNAQLSHYRLQSEPDGASHFGGTYVGVDRDGRYRNATVSIGGAIVRNDIVVALNGTGADCQLDGLVVGKNRTHVDNFTRIEHNAPHGTSREHYRSVLDDRSRSIFHGRVYVAKDAQKTDAQQSNQSLLLSDSCEADSKPQLEIYADDVKCAHGAIVGQLDEKSVFYLKSRGIGDEDARGMLTLAFASEVLSGFDNEAVARYAGKSVTSLLAPDLAEDENVFEGDQ